MIYYFQNSYCYCAALLLLEKITDFGLWALALGLCVGRWATIKNTLLTTIII